MQLWVEPCWQKAGPCSWPRAPGPAHTPGDTEVALSVDIPQCCQKSVSWKVAQELHSVTRKGMAVLCIFGPLVLGVDLRTTDCPGYAPRHLLPGCRLSESLLP